MAVGMEALLSVEVQLSKALLEEAEFLREEETTWDIAWKGLWRQNVGRCDGG